VCEVQWSIFVALFEYNCSAVAQIGDRLATIDMGRNKGLLCPFRRNSWVPIYNIMWPGPRLYLLTKWHLDPSSDSSRLATTDMGRKLEGCCAPCFGGAGSLSNTTWPPRPTIVPSWGYVPPQITIHQRYRQDRQDNGPIATVLQTVAQILNQLV